MNRLIQLNKSNSLFVIAFSLACFAVVPTAWAVTPAPDGGYPGGNTAEGTNALFSHTSGLYNTAVGLNALYADRTGGRNTGLGFQTLRFNVAGARNTAVGVNALLHNRNSYNTAIGDSALFNNTTANYNTASGFHALFSNTEGSENTASGSAALFSNTGGNQNTAIGANALYHNIGGVANTAIGFQALLNTTTGLNTAVGASALVNDTTGDSNVALGIGAGSAVTTASNVICIGAAGGNISNSCFIGHIFGAMSAFGSPVYVDIVGHLFTINSARRFKDNIKPMDKASEVLFALKPVTFRYKKEFDPAGIPQFGLVAEDVEKVNPDLVVRDADGKVRTVRYEQINAMLLNEFLKEHRKVEQLEKQVEKLTVGLQKVSAQLEASKPAPQVVNNP